MSANREAGQNPGTEAAIWKRYGRALEQAGVPEERWRWYQRDCKRFIG